MKGLLETSQAHASQHHKDWLALSEKKDQLIESLKTRIETLKRDAAEAVAKPVERSVSTKERDSLLSLVIGMAMAAIAMTQAQSAMMQQLR